MLSERVKVLRNPLTDLKINYGQIKGKHFSDEEDRYLVYFLFIFKIIMLQKFGYGMDSVYELIKAEIKLCSLFRFNWFMKSRTAAVIYVLL